MGNHRRKRRRRSPKCGLCTPNRCGNTKNGTHGKVLRQAARRGADKHD